MEQIEERFESERRDKVCLGLSIDKCFYRLEKEHNGMRFT